jgi:hypothetical protein
LLLNKDASGIRFPLSFWFRKMYNPKNTNPIVIHFLNLRG